MNKNRAYDLLLKDPTIKNILLVYEGRVLGDFIHKLLPLAYSIKLYKPEVKLTVYTINKNRGVQIIGSKCTDLFEFYQMDDDTVYDFVYKFEKYEVEMDRILYKNIYYTENRTSFIFPGWHTAECIPYLHPDFRVKLHQYFREKFYTTENVFDIGSNDIVLNIGGTTRNKGQNSNRLFQDRLADVIEGLPGSTFYLIGFPGELTSDKLKECLLRKNVRNLLGKEKDILDGINILFHCRLIIVRSTGFMHLAGICNTDIITLNSNTSAADKWATWLTWRSNTVTDMLYYKEQWSPMSDRVTCIMEYKKYNPVYNSSVAGLIIKEINRIIIYNEYSRNIL